MSKKIAREPYGVAYREKAGFKDTYGGEEGHVFIECMRIYPSGTTSDTVIVFSHPVGGGAFLPVMGALAKAGFHVIYVNTRYRGNDSALIMEKCVADLGAGIEDAKARFGYSRVIQGGWSGGGSLALFYQDMAENDRLTHTAAGDPYDLNQHVLPQSDGIMLIAAHVSRAVTMTEWIDPSIEDELDPYNRVVELDLYNPENTNQPAYQNEFLARFYEAQLKRNRRITTWVKQKLQDQKSKGREFEEFGFVTHGTMACPAFLDPLVDPSERQAGVCYLGDPKVVNMGPVGLARFSTLRSWLSQWSYDDTPADGIGNASRITCPVLVIGNLADTACTPSHARRLFEAVGHSDKEMYEISGATHYYVGQPKQLKECVELCSSWLERKFAGVLSG